MREEESADTLFSVEQVSADVLDASPASPLQAWILAQEWEQAYLWLCEQYEQDVWRYLQRHWGDLNVHDIFQETFTSVWRSIQSITDIQNLKAWLLKIARCRAIDHKRKLSSTQALVEAESVLSPVSMLQAVLSPEQSYLTREVMEKLHEAVGELDPAQQELLSLFYVQELEQKDIAVLFDISVQTVKMRLFHIRAKLKKSLRLHHPDLFAKVGE